MSDIDDKLLTTFEAAHVCRMHHATLEALRKSGKGPRFLRPADARRYLYRKSDLIAWLEGRLLPKSEEVR
jgi:hypothetical protein